MSLIIPQGVDDILPKVEPIYAGDGGVAWMIEQGDGWDVIWLREPHAAQKLFLSTGDVLEMEHEFGIFLTTGERFFR